MSNHYWEKQEPPIKHWMRNILIGVALLLGIVVLYESGYWNGWQWLRWFFEEISISTAWSLYRLLLTFSVYYFICCFFYFAVRFIYLLDSFPGSKNEIDSTACVCFGFFAHNLVKEIENLLPGNSCWNFFKNVKLHHETQPLPPSSLDILFCDGMLLSISERKLL